MALIYPNWYLYFELLGFGAFAAIIIREALQKNKLRLFEIISCAVFGVILEVGDTALAHSYSYSANFLIQIFHVPLVIGCGWAVVIYCAMLLSDQYNISWYFRPFLDALTALTLDLSMDVVAIRLGFWHWLVPLNQEWYGVPYENLVGWILVVLSFSFLIRFIRTLNPRRNLTKILMLLSPILSYIGLMAGFALYGLLSTIPYSINNWATFISFNYHPDPNIIYNPQVQLWKLIILAVMVTELVNLAVLAVVRHRKNYLWRFDALSFFLLSAMHLFFAAAIFYTGIYRQLPIAVAISLVAFLVHCLLHFLPFLLSPKKVYIFKDIEKTIKKEEKQITALVDESFR